MSTRTRKQIKKLIKNKHDKIKQLDSEIIALNREAILLSDKTQRFVEKEEEVLICGRPKKYETRLIGRVFWKQEFKDQDTGEPFTIERNVTVRVNGVWEHLIN